MFDCRSVRRVLVIKLRYIGDVVLSTPFVEGLKRFLPHASIDMLVNQGTEEVLRGNPHLDRVWVLRRTRGWGQIRLCYELRRIGYDLVLDLSDSDRSAIFGFLAGARYRIGFNDERRWRGRLYHGVVRADRQKVHTVEYHRAMLREIGCDAGSEAPRLYPSNLDRAKAGELLRNVGVGKDERFFLLSSGARWPFKSWPAGRFAELARKVHQSFGFSAVLVGGEKDREIAEGIAASCGSWAGSLAGETTILEMAALAERAAFFVGNDAGPMHVAAAMNTPVAALFGPTDPGVWGPVGERHRTLWKGIDCHLCWRAHSCGLGELNCMRQITVGEAFEAIRNLIAERVDA